MKKIVSLVLAAAMLSTTAFGAINITPGASSVTNPGETLYILPSAFADTKVPAVTLAGAGWRFSSEYFSVAAKKFGKGANLVKEVKINDDDNRLEIVLNDNYELVRPKLLGGANLVIDDITVKAKKAYDADGNSATPYVQGDIKKSAVYEYTYTGTQNELKVGYDQDNLAVYEQYLDATPSYVEGTMVKFKAANSVNYETVSLDGVDLVYIEGRVYDGNKVFIGVDYDVNKDILKLDDTAAMNFINIKTNGLPTANILQITAEEDEFVYKIVDGKLTASGLKWSADDYAWVGKIRTSASYVISDVELKAAAAVEGGATTDNPDTGANDVVGIAAALAVVSLVAAGAVSLKK